MKHNTLITTLIIGLVALFPMFSKAATASEIDRDVTRAASQLYDINPTARRLSKTAKAVLIFPKIVKAGLIVGGQFGEGAMREGGRTVGYYSTAAASYGFEAGVAQYGYALFFMDANSLAYLKRSRGWEIGAGPTVIIVDEGVAKSLSSTTLQKGVYAFFFNQKGLMAGASLQGSKITRIHPH